MLIADDHQLMLAGLTRLIENDCEVLEVVENGRDLVARTFELQPDLVLIDVTMPLLNGIEAARKIRERLPAVKLVFVTMQRNATYVREAFEAGASGYVLKQAAASELGDAIKTVQQGRFFLSKMITDALPPESFSTEKNPAMLFRKLTPRQREILQLIAEGKSAKEIAWALSISAKTVEFHKKRLLEELHLETTADLIRYAVTSGWSG